MTVLQADWLTILIRLSLAILAGALIGLERELDDKPAGLRTHMLVSLGAAVFVLVGIQIGTVEASADSISRIIQGITAGIGFLGAGEIINQVKQSGEVKVQGLTSAAAIWVSASLGVAAGCGLWAIALFGAIATLIILRVAKKLEGKIKCDRK
ncbi:MAG: MgtC/SapB family protein [Timaviella obliquedivisa GSE-PSE-MK23-08B]|jgi:putative Mg2+ transporter-C (MgtC) family protein|nr:MgtC/SapB family protein [Timaviella obliquedivisa GSE-PSE-MK23-08B]